MEQLSAALQPYKEIVGQFAGIVTVAQFFSGIFICRDVYKKKSTEKISSAPFLGGIAIGILMYQYGVMLNDSVMLQVNIAAVFLNVLYLAFYYVYSQNKVEDVLKPGTVWAGIAAIFLGYLKYENPALVEYRYGLACTVLMLGLIAMPLAGLKTIIKEKDASSIPFVMTLMGSIVTLSWLVYGIILLNEFMIVQNLVAVVLCLLQLGLIYKYPGKSGATKTKSKGKKQTKKTK